MRKQWFGEWLLAQSETDKYVDFINALKSYFKYQSKVQTITTLADVHTLLRGEKGAFDKWGECSRQALNEFYLQRKQNVFVLIVTQKGAKGVYYESGICIERVKLPRENEKIALPDGSLGIVKFVLGSVPNYVSADAIVGVEVPE